MEVYKSNRIHRTTESYQVFRGYKSSLALIVDMQDVRDAYEANADCDYLVELYANQEPTFGTDGGSLALEEARNILVMHRKYCIAIEKSIDTNVLHDICEIFYDCLAREASLGGITTRRIYNMLYDAEKLLDLCVGGDGVVTYKG